MSVTVRLTAPARHDLVERYAYIGENNLEAADQFIEAVDAAVVHLADMPASGALREFKDSRLEGTRLWPVPGYRNYIIFYQLIEDELRILRVLHAAQDYGRIFSNDPPPL